MRVAEDRHRLPRVVVETSYSVIFKSHLDFVLGNGLQVALLEQHHGLDDLPQSLPASTICDSMNYLMILMTQRIIILKTLQSGQDEARSIQLSLSPMHSEPKEIQVFLAISQKSLL